MLGGALIKVGTQYNTLEQSSRAAFTTILGSGEAATAMMGDLREFAKTSPFPRQAFIEGTQQLLGFGVSAKQIIPTLSAIQDSVAAVGGGANEISQITYALAQVKGQGKLTGETLNQLGQFGIDAASILGQQFGKTSAEIRDMATKPGGIPADQVFDPLVKGLTEKFGGAAEGLKGTWTGAVDRIRGAFRDIASDLAEPFISKAGGGAAVEWANTIADLMRKIQTTIIPVLAAGLSGLAGKITPFVTKFSDFVKGLSTADVQGFLSKLISGFDKVRSVFSSIGPIVAGLGTALGTFGAGGLPFIGPLLSGLNPLVTGLIAIAAASPEVRAALAPLIPIFSDLAKTLLSSLKPVLPVVAEAIGAVADVVGRLLSAGIDALVPIFTSIVEAVVPLIPVFAGLVESLGGPLISIVSELAPVLGTVAQAFGGALSDALKTLAPVLPIVADAIAQVAVAVGQDLATGLIALTPAIPALAELVRVGAELIASIPPGVLAKIVEAFLLFKGVQAATSGVQGFTADVRDAGATLVGFKDGLTGTAEKISTFFKAGGGKDTIGIRFLQIGDAASRVGGVLADAGRAVLDYGKASALTTIELGQQGAAWVATNARMLATKVEAVAVAVSQYAVAAATGVWSAAQWLLNAALTANPIGLLVVGIAALVGAVVLAYTNINVFRSAVDATVGFIVSNWPIALAVLTGGMSLVAAVIIKNWSTIRGAVESGIDAVVGFFTDMPDRIISAVGDFGRLLFQAGRDVVQGFIDGVESKFSFVQDALEWLTDKIPEWKPISEDRQLLRPAGELVVQGLVDGMESKFPEVQGALRDLTTDISRFNGEGAKTALIPTGEAITLGLVKGIDTEKPRVRVSVDALIAAVNAAAQGQTSRSFYFIGRNLANDLALGIKDVSPEIDASVVSVIQARQQWNGLAELSADQISSGFGFHLIKGFEKVATQVAAPFFDTLPKISDILNNAGDNVDLSGLSAKLGEAATQTETWLKGMETAVAAGKPALSNQIASLGVESGSALAEAYANATPEVQAQFDLMLSGTDTALINAKQRALEFIPAFAESGVALSASLSKGYSDSITLGDISLAEVGRAAVAIATNPDLPTAGLFQGGEVTGQFGEALRLSDVSDVAMSDAAALVRLNKTLPEGHHILAGTATMQYLQALLLSGATEQQIAAAAGVFTNGTGAVEGTAFTGGSRVGAAWGNGVKVGIFGTQRTINQAVDDAIFGATNFGMLRLNANSPSKLTRDLLGQPFGEGIAAGINDTYGAIRDAASGAIDVANDAGKRGLKSLTIPAPSVSGRDLAALQTLTVEATAATAGRGGDTFPIEIHALEPGEPLARAVVGEISWRQRTSGKDDD